MRSSSQRQKRSIKPVQRDNIRDAPRRRLPRQPPASPQLPRQIPKPKKQKEIDPYEIVNMYMNGASKTSLCRDYGLTIYRLNKLIATYVNEGDSEDSESSDAYEEAY